MSQPILPGDTDPYYGARDDIATAAIHGTIRAVDTRQGFVSIQFQHGASGRPNVRIPIFQLSVLGAKSSWFRFMPQVGDLVTLVRNLNGHFHIVNYEAINYRQLTESHEADLYLFRELKEGEYELRSRGGATIWGSADGILRLAGGPASLTLRRTESDAVQSAGLHRLVSVACEVRFGEVRRQLLPIDAEETTITGAWEWRATLANELDAKLVDVAVGNVVADTTPWAPLVSGQAAPLRAHLRVYDAAGATVAHEVSVDLAGNVAVESAATATAIDLTALMATLHLHVRDVVFQPSGTFRLGGAGAAENMLLGQQVKAMMLDLLSTLRSAVVATSWGPAGFSPTTIAAIEALQTQYIASNAILSDYAYVSKVPVP